MTTYTLDRELSDFAPGGDGDVGGDIQAGRSMSIRAVYRGNDAAAPFLVVDTYAYPVAYGDEGGPIDIQLDGTEGTVRYGVDLMESLVTCADYHDPGSTEVWADMTYPTPDLWALVYFMDTLDNAEGRLAETLVGYAHRDDRIPETLDAP